MESIEKKGNYDYLVFGLALFSMFFGAGNLIFPPSLGLAAGDNWFLCMLGFLVTGVGMPVLGIIAVAKAGGTVNHLASRVNPIFSKILGASIILIIGPLVAIPRTGATVYELGFRTLIPSISPILVAIIYSLIILFFVINPSSVIDKIGKILTPLLLAIIGLLIFRGIISPIGSSVSSEMTGAFSNGFIEGYQTMDALASIIFGGIILFSLTEKGYTSKDEKIKITTKAGIIAGLGLSFVYGGLMFLGASGGSIFSTGIERTSLIVSLSEYVLGTFGKVSLSLIATIACLTTAIGLTATVGNYFEDLSNKKLSYKFLVVATVVVSGVLSITGVDNIIKFAGPILGLIYPVVIVLILMGILDSFIKNKNIYAGTVYGAFIGSLVDLLLPNILPLSDLGFPWILPALVGGIIFSFLKDKKEVLTAEYK